MWQDMQVMWQEVLTNIAGMSFSSMQSFRSPANHAGRSVAIAPQSRVLIVSASNIRLHFKCDTSLCLAEIFLLQHGHGGIIMAAL